MLTAPQEHGRIVHTTKIYLILRKPEDTKYVCTVRLVRSSVSSDTVSPDLVVKLECNVECI